MRFEFLSSILLLPVMVASHYYKMPEKPECECSCSGFLAGGSTRSMTFCQKLSRFEKEFFTVKQEIERRTHYIKEIHDLKERMELQEDLIETLLEQLETLKKQDIRNPSIPLPEPLIMRPEDQMLGDDSRISRLIDDDRELAKNVSNLLAKVEEVENLTSKVQEELKSERRVRRHLEEDLNETRSSIKILDDKFQNVTLPMNSRVDHVEEIMLSTLESMNKTLFEEHLQKLYYKVDGVVYKNETKKLDERLDHVEAELSDVSNTSIVLQLADGLKTLNRTLHYLNQTVTEKLNSEAERLESLEQKSSQLDRLDDVDEQLAIILNVTELIQSGVSHLWIDIQDIRNDTFQLEKKIISQVEELNDSTEAVRLGITQQLDNVSAEVITLKSDIIKGNASISNLQREVQILSADLAIVENRVEGAAIAMEARIKDVFSKIDNLTEQWDNTFSTIVSHFIEQKMTNQNKSVESTSTDTPSYVATASITFKTTPKPTDEEFSRGRSKGAEVEFCSLPTINDTHLLVSIQNGTDGSQQLEFGCRPIGKYALSRPPVPLRCRDGRWHGSFPSCVRLLDEEEVEDFARELRETNPCLHSNGDFPDPTNCSQFFKCWDGNAQRMNCPVMLHFNTIAKRCEYPTMAMCRPYFTEESKRLRDLIPPIHISPDTVDKPNGLLGTGDTGNLIVYPRTSFRLHCIFPESRWGLPSWDINLFLSTSSEKEVNIEEGKNRVTVIVTAASTEDSGVYTCRTPFGKQHSITVLVQAVTCPAIVSGSGALLDDTFYRPHPDGMYRSLTTTVQYPCADGRTITAMCQANGKWSKPPPTEDECLPKKSEDSTIWGCPLINTEDQPDLFLERDDRNKKIRFKCAGSTRLVGNIYTKCYGGTWTHTALPSCVPKTY